MKKNEEFIVDIIDNGFQGEGIAKIDGIIVFIPNAIKGEKIRIKILKVTTSHAFGKILEIIENSKDRVNEDCKTHKIIPTEICRIQDKQSQKIANYIFDFILKNNISVYDEKKLSGALRHIIIRIGKKTNEIMVTLVTNERKIEKEQELVNYVISNFPEVKTIVKNINSKNTNVILGEKNMLNLQAKK